MIKSTSGLYVSEQDKQGLGYALNDVHTCEHIIPFTTQKRTCIQAGGHVGVYPLFYAKHFKEVKTFEPNDLSREALLKNVEAVQNIQVYDKLLYSVAGLESFLKPVTSSNLGSSKLTTSGQPISAATIDSFEFEDVDLIHFDIEGAEYHALLGAKKTILKYKPVIVVEDLGHKVGKEGFQDVLKLLIELGYTPTRKFVHDVVFIPVTEEQKIPKKIHQIWLGDKDIPSRYLAYSETWKTHFPTWEYKLWKDADVAELIAESKLPTFITDKHNVGALSDILRYIILDKFGGLYIDMDYECLAPFEECLMPACFHYGDERQANPANALLISPPKHPITQLLLQQFKHGLPASIWPGCWPTVELTGPSCLRRALSYWVGSWYPIAEMHSKDSRFGLQYPGLVFSIDQPVIYPYTYGNPATTWLTFTREKYPRAKAAHHWSSDWIKLTSKPVPIVEGGKILVLGSAPYIKDWWEANKTQYLAENYTIVAINNAWQVPAPKLPDLWIFSEDYYDTSSKLLHPPQEVFDKMTYINTGIDRTKLLSPITYTSPEDGGTMLLDALCVVANQKLKNKQSCSIVFAGCDLNYPEGDNSHFYEGGKADPLRNGTVWIERELAKLKTSIPKLFQEAGLRFEAFNGGGKAQSLLPFPMKF